MTAVATLPSDHLKSECFRTVGQLVCLYAELELAMRRFIDVLVDASGLPQEPGAPARNPFHPPLRVLKVLVPARYAHEPLKLRKFRRWRNRVNKLRKRRNLMIHGSWIDECGTLRFRAAGRDVCPPADEPCGHISAAQMAKDMRFLNLDIAAIKAWAATV